MAEYIERDKTCEDCVHYGVCYHIEHYGRDIETDEPCEEFKSDDVVEVVHGEWNLEVCSFYADNWDESIELCVYILASCSNCGEKHHQHQVFSKHLYAPEDADDDFRFDQEYEKSKALEEFKQKGYKFQNYCPNCGADMRGEKNE